MLRPKILSSENVWHVIDMLIPILSMVVLFSWHLYRPATVLTTVVYCALLTMISIRAKSRFLCISSMVCMVFIATINAVIMGNC